MKARWIVALVLIIAGTLALAYGGFSYTKDSETVNLGPIQLTVQEKESVNIPVWAGVASIVLGAGMLAVPLMTRG